MPPTKPRIARAASAIGAGLCLVAFLLWGLAETLRDRDPRYRGRTSFEWSELATNGPVGLRDEAIAVARELIVPDLVRRIRSDTNDSPVAMALAGALNGLPGIDIQHTAAEGRRNLAVQELGMFGTNSAAAIPLLLEYLRATDEDLCGSSAEILPRIGATAETMVPLLVERLRDANGHGRPIMVEALGGYGPKARAAYPALLALRGDRSSKEIIFAVPAALKAIDPGAAARDGVK
jgi:hypothetical protein